MAGLLVVIAFLTLKINPLWILAAGGMIGGALLGG